jgi:hypothetical protein
MKKYLWAFYFAVFVLFSFQVAGQPNYKSGYIITLKNDTVAGFINDRGELRNSMICQFKEGKKAKPVKYSPADIKAYRINGGKYYAAKEVFFKDQFSYIFADVLLKGEVSLYYDRRNKEKAYYLQRNDGELVDLVNQQVSVNRQVPDFGYQPYGSSKYGVILSVYKDTLYSFFKNCDKVRNQARNVEYNHKSLMNVTKAYLRYTCKGDDCLSYEKDLTVSRPSLGIYSGMQVSQIMWRSKAKSDLIYSFPVGLFYNVPLNLIDPRLSFQAEMTYSYMNHNQLYNNLLDTIQYMEIMSASIGIPILLKYEFPGKRISPSFAFGKETSVVINSDITINHVDELYYHKTQKSGWFFQAGLSYKVAPKLSLFSNIRVQANRNIIVYNQFQQATYKDAVENKLNITECKTSFAALHIGLKF